GARTNVRAGRELAVREQDQEGGEELRALRWRRLQRTGRSLERGGAAFDSLPRHRVLAQRLEVPWLHHEGPQLRGFTDALGSLRQLRLRAPDERVEVREHARTGSLARHGAAEGLERLRSVAAMRRPLEATSRTAEADIDPAHRALF